MTRAHLYLIFHLAKRVAGSHEEATQRFPEVINDAVYAVEDKHRERATAEWIVACSPTMEHLQKRMADHAMFLFKARQQCPVHVAMLARELSGELEEWPDCPFDVDPVEWEGAKKDIVRWANMST